MRHIARLIILALCAAALPLRAAHITDKLVVGLYPGPSAEGTPSRLLSSGTPLDVLDRKDGFTQVRLADDASGWVESTYITDEKPAMAMLLETQAKLRLMGMELAAMRERQGGADAAPSTTADAPSVQEARMRQALAGAEARIAELEQRLAATPDGDPAQQRLQELQGRVDQALRLLAEGQEPIATTASRGVVARYQTWIVGLITLLLGFGGGVAFIDYRIRRRYGGFRL